MKPILASLLLLAACGDRVHHGRDAGPPDVSPDTLTTNIGDPPPNATKLIITRAGMPVSAAVVFQDANSAVVSAVLTNDQGLAWAVVPAGGFVTAIEHIGSGSDELTTFAQVQQSETLLVELAPTGARGETPISIIVSADSGASFYHLYTSCGGPFAVDPAAYSDIPLVGCSGTANMLVVSSDSSGQPLRTVYAGDVALPSGPLATDATNHPTLSIIGMYMDFSTATFAYSDVPSTINWISTYHSFADAHGRTFDGTVGDAPVGTSANLSLQMPDANAATLTVTTGFAPGEIGQQLVYDERAAGAGPYALDLGGAMLPSYATAPSFDVAARTLKWTERSGAVAIDLVRTRLHLYRDDIPAGRSWSWRMVAPRSGTSVVYPHLPSFGFDFNPASTDTVAIDELTTASVPGGYDAVRTTAFGDFTQAVMAAPGRLVVQTLAMEQL